MQNDWVMLLMMLVGVASTVLALVIVCFVLPRIRNGERWHVLGLSVLAAFYTLLGHELWLFSAGKMPSLVHHLGVSATAVFGAWMISLGFAAKLFIASRNDPPPGDLK